MTLHCDEYNTEATLKVAVEALAPDKFVFLLKSGISTWFLLWKD